MAIPPTSETLEPDLRQAERFLTLLSEPDIDWTFQTIDDNASRKDGSLTRIFHTQDGKVAKKLSALNMQGAGVFAMINRGDGKGRKAENVTEVRAVFVDLDGTPLAVLDDAPLEPQFVVETSPGHYHAYWRIEGLALEQFEAVQLALARRFGGDPAVKDLPRVMRVPGYYHQKDVPFKSRIIREALFQPYQAKKFLAAFGIDPTWQPRLRPMTGNGEKVQEGGRNSYLASLAGSMRWRGMSQAAIEAALQVENEQHCEPPLDPDEVAHIAQSIGRYKPADSAAAQGVQFTAQWPEPLASDAYYGLTGEIVRAIEPHTEADPAAILVQFLVAFGSIVGRGPHFVVEADQHNGNLFVVVVGDTSKGRKGTSLGRVRQLFGLVADSWSTSRVQSGLSSGEGLIWAVRDAVHKDDDGKEVLVDAGVEDKRLLLVESEFANVLRVIERDGNTLSAILRQAWDAGDLRTLTKNSPSVATGAHISTIGHIVADEMRRYLTRTESANGFANRFLFICTRRSKCLPEGGQPVALSGYAHRLAEVIGHARTVGRMGLDEAARAIWHAVYPEISEGLPGLLGAVISRAEAQVIRVALLYALLDRSPRIGVPHLRAALALWKYAEASARYIFGSALGDPVADAILRALRVRPSGLTRTDISGLFKRNKQVDQIDRALQLLASARLASCRSEGNQGRPAEVWVAN